MRFFKKLLNIGGGFGRRRSEEEKKRRKKWPVASGRLPV
jgi:hypothetical protein